MLWRVRFDGAIKTTELAWVRAKQMIDRITVMRYQIFSRHLFERRASPLLPSVWHEVADRIPTIVSRTKYYGGGLDRAGHKQGRAVLAILSARSSGQSPDQGLSSTSQIARAAAASRAFRHSSIGSSRPVTSRPLGCWRRSRLSASSTSVWTRSAVLRAMGAHGGYGASGFADLYRGLGPGQRRARAEPTAVAPHSRR